MVFTLTGFLLVSNSHADSSFEQELKQGCAKISQYRQIGQKFYDQKNYKKALEQFQNQAAWTPFCQSNGEEIGLKVSDKEVDIANNNVGLTYAKLGKPLWARAWFQLESTKMSQFNLKQLPIPSFEPDLSGQYVTYAGFGAWNYIIVKKLNSKYHIEFEGLYLGLRGLIYGPNLGTFETTMPLNQKKATTQQCGIRLNFDFNTQKGNFVKIEQSESSYNCEYFGHNVSADGIYQKVEAR